MQELSMNILDIAENSVVAGATLIEIIVSINHTTKKLNLIIEDNGKGMSKQVLETVLDPFTTSRTTRRVGLGLPLLKMAAEQTGGKMSISSILGKGTRVEAYFTLGHIDLMPLGDIASTISSLIQCNPEIDFVFTLSDNSSQFILKTQELREVLGEDISFASPEIALWINEYLHEQTIEIVKRSMII